MKNFLFALFFMGIAVYLSFELYERVQKQNEKEAGAATSSEVVRARNVSEQSNRLRFPDEIQIARQDGHRLDIRLQARDATHIQFERLSDGLSFTFEIDKLDEASKKRVLKYPNSGLQNLSDLAATGELTLEQAYLEQLQVAIDRINQKMHVIQSKYKATESKVERLTLDREYQALLEERKIAETKIAERRQD
jgi:hypothetical protein